MRHRKKGKTLDRKFQPRKALLRNLATNLVLHEKIQTTEAKAKALRPIFEKLVTKAKKGDLSARRELLKYLYLEVAVKKMMDEIGPRYKDRKGGYTRISKLGSRQGDGAQIAQIELI